MRALWMGLSALWLVALQSPAASQEPAAQPRPAFQTATELLRLQVSVAGHDGQAIADLRATDFTVTIDGLPRTVRVATYYGRGSEPGGAPATPRPATPLPQRQASNTASAPGRVVVFIVDRESMRAGSGKAVLESASRLLDDLSPSDASGFVALPAGRMVLGRDHGRLRESIQQAVGTGRAPAHWRYHLDLREVQAFDRRDVFAINQVIQRECLNESSDCGTHVSTQAGEMLLALRADTRATLQALRQVVDGLREVRAPKLIVLLSAGVFFEIESLTEFNLITRQAAASRTVIHALHIDQVAFDAEERGRGPSMLAAPERQDGLRQIAASTGGTFFAAVGTAAGVFERIGREVTSFYEIGIELKPEDMAANAARTVRVDVNRSGAIVRSRRDILLPPPPASAPPATRLDELVRQPVDVQDLPLRLSTYVTRGEEPTTLKVILASEIGASGLPSNDAEWAFVVFRDDEVMAFGRDRTTARVPVVTAAQLPPGRYRLRFAALAANGLEGVVETDLPVGLRPHGDLESSDVILGQAGQDSFQPGSSFGAGSEIRALLELYAAEPDRFEDVVVAWELYRAPEMSLVAASPSRPELTNAPGRRVCETALAVPDIAGDYVLSAVVLQRRKPLGKVSRSLVVR